MNLIDLYRSLSIPESGNTKAFNAIPISDYPNFRVATDVEGNPVLLLSVVNAVKNTALKNYRLKYLQLEQNKECKVIEGKKITFQRFTIITFLNADWHLQEYFLRISESLIRSLNNNSTQQQVIETLGKFIEVFRSLSDAPTNTVQGLWAELFLIENAFNSRALLNCWHNLPEEKFDFNSGEEIIEVKSSSNFERIHTFSSEQLNPPEGIQALIASIFTKQNGSGKNIEQLLENITLKIQNDIELTYKLNNVVCKTLGNSLEQSIKMCFDYQIAKESLLFYNQRDISKIEKIDIPTEVSDVKYKSDLSAIKPVEISTLKPKGILFRSIYL
jgi:hypothetical protein